uniref:hypothetical protein n=1 Tax=Ningiella ruwaisensis TaxID=2364274 RepID=UPI00109FBF75|nr:hypothetical protein [Ningiella ruwaisensis]
MKLSKKTICLIIGLNASVILFGSIFIFSDSAVLEEIEEAFFDKQEEPEVYICGNKLPEVANFKKSFLNRKSVKKMAGSEPVEFFLLQISNSADSARLFLGRDSKNSNLYWIYPFEKPDLISQLGYLQLEMDLSSINCDGFGDIWLSEIYGSKKND